MAITSDIGFFTEPTSTGNQNISHNLGVTPDIVFFIRGHPTALNTGTAAVDTAIGFGDASSYGCLYTGVGSNLSSSGGRSDAYTDAVLAGKASAGNTEESKATIGALSSTQITLNWSAVNSNEQQIMFMAVAGFTEWGHVTFDTPSSTGDATKAHGLAGTPDYCTVLVGGGKAFDTHSTNAFTSLGFWNGGVQASQPSYQNSALYSNNLSTGYTHGFAHSTWNNSGHSIFEDFDATNLNYNCVTAHFDNHRGFVLFFRGGKFSTGSITVPSSTGAQTARNLSLDLQNFVDFIDLGLSTNQALTVNSDWSSGGTSPVMLNSGVDIIMPSTGGAGIETAYHSGGTYDDDQYCSGWFRGQALTDTGSWRGVAVRMDSDEDCYAFVTNFDNTQGNTITWKVGKYISSSWTQLDTGTYTWGLTYDYFKKDVFMTLAVVGDKLTAYIDGREVSTVTDTAQTTGYPGLYFDDDGSRESTGFQCVWMGNASEVECKVAMFESIGCDKADESSSDWYKQSIGFGTDSEAGSFWYGGDCNTTPSNYLSTSYMDNSNAIIGKQISGTDTSPTAEWAASVSDLSDTNNDLSLSFGDAHASADIIFFWGFGDALAAAAPAGFFSTALGGDRIRSSRLHSTRLG